MVNHTGEDEAIHLDMQRVVANLAQELPLLFDERRKPEIEGGLQGGDCAEIVRPLARRLKGDGEVERRCTGWRR